MKFAVLVLNFCCLFGYLRSASIEVNVKLGTTTAEIAVSFTSTVFQFQSTQATALYQESQWVRTAITELSTVVDQFLLEIAAINTRYQTQTEYLAAPAIRDSLANIIVFLKKCQNVAKVAELSEATSITEEVNAVVTILESVRVTLVDYSASTATTIVRLLASTFPDEQTTALTDGLSRCSKVIIKTVTGISKRVTEETDFAQLVSSLDYQTAVQTGNTVAANIAITTQTRYFEAVSSTSTAAANTALSSNKVIYDSFSSTIIIEFNVLGAYAQTEVNRAVLSIQSSVSSTTAEEIYRPIGQKILDGLADAYREINAEFQVAIKDAKNEIESSKPGENGSNSSNQSNGSDETSEKDGEKSLKGEVKKCSKRARGLIVLIQGQYSKSNIASICGASSILSINAQLSSAQTKLNVCASRSVVGFRTVLEEVKTLIRTELDATILALEMCASEAGGNTGGDMAGGGTGGEGSNQCQERRKIRKEARSGEGSQDGAEKSSKEASVECTGVSLWVRSSLLNSPDQL